MSNPVRSPALAAVAIATVIGAVAGCAGPAPQAAAPAAPASHPAAMPAGRAPVLGRLAGVFAHGTGFGKARPRVIFNGGDPTGMVTHMTWESWGSPQATGSGTAEWVGPGQSVATGTAQRVTVVAFRLGTCHGIRMYEAVEWYFPQHGQAFDPGRYENVCAGSYVPGP